MGYQGLFWVDGSTCIIAILIFAFYIKEKKKIPAVIEDSKPAIPKSIYKDKPFWLLLFISFVTFMVFLQIFSTVTLYHNEKFGLSEFQTGMLLSINGLLVFLLEMPIVSRLERKKANKIRNICYGSLCIAAGYYVLLLDSWVGILVISIVLLTLGEIFSFPFANAVALNRAPKGQEGQYMGLYTMSFSLAHIVSSKMGLDIISRYGYAVNWFIMGTLAIFAFFCGIWLNKMIRNEQNNS
jgi:predicted MFS family arabinose efflux permease